MLYLGIDQHARQITISLRDDYGDVILARQVSTKPDKINAFFDGLTRDRAQSDESFVAVLDPTPRTPGVTPHEPQCYRSRRLGLKE